MPAADGRAPPSRTAARRADPATADQRSTATAQRITAMHGQPTRPTPHASRPMPKLATPKPTPTRRAAPAQVEDDERRRRADRRDSCRPTSRRRRAGTSSRCRAIARIRFARRCSAAWRWPAWTDSSATSSCRPKWSRSSRGARSGWSSESFIPAIWSSTWRSTRRPGSWCARRPASAISPVRPASPARCAARKSPGSSPSRKRSRPRRRS